MDELKINNYIFETPMTNDNSGFSRWGFARRNRELFFVKEFLSPTYPVDQSLYEEEQYQKRIEECKRFEQEKRELYSAINNASDGNSIRIQQFFREKAKYYIVTKAVQEPVLTEEEIAELPLQEKLLICTIVAHTVAKLHESHIIHADIKPDNILVTNESRLRAKLIDFDCSFFVENVPELGNELNGDFVYLSPEAFLHMAEIESNLSCKMDIFALGVLFHVYLSGRLPVFDKKEYTYAYEAVLNGADISFSTEIPKSYEEILLLMLSRKPEDRPVAESVFTFFQAEYLKVVEESVNPFLMRCGDL